MTVCRKKICDNWGRLVSLFQSFHCCAATRVVFLRLVLHSPWDNSLFKLLFSQIHRCSKLNQVHKDTRVLVRIPGALIWSGFNCRKLDQLQTTWLDFDGHENGSATNKTDMFAVKFQKCGINHLHGDVPGHVDVAFKLIHPNLRHSEGVPSDVGGEVLGVRFMGSLYVCDASAGQDLDAAATLPHLMKESREGRKVTHPHQ